MSQNSKRETSSNGAYCKKPKLAQNLSNRELQMRICRDVDGGCAACPVLDVCQYGQENLRRKKKAS